MGNAVFNSYSTALNQFVDRDRRQKLCYCPAR